MTNAVANESRCLHVTLGGRKRQEEDDSETEPAINIVCISCPSVNQSIVSLRRCNNVRCFLLENDLRFSVYSPFFVYYDLHAPVQGCLRSCYTALTSCTSNAETLSLIMQTVELLRRRDGDGCRVIVKTGAVTVLRDDKLWRAWGLRAAHV